MGPLLILLIVAALLWAAGFLLLGQLRFPSVSATGVRPESVSVIVPARNEAHNLPNLLRSLNDQAVKPGEMLVVDDGSTDGTATIARQMGARVLVSEPLPSGWRGKTWACHQGARAASGDYLLFVDADTWFEPGGLCQVLAEYPGGAFSVGPYHVMRRPYEQLSLFFNISMTAGTVPHGLFGQMMLVDRQHYAQAGGHESVKGWILENFRLAARFRERGAIVGSVPGRGRLSFRMYPGGPGELVEGWTKAFSSGAGKTPGRVLFVTIAWMTGLMLAAIGLLATREILTWGSLYLACALQVAWVSRRVGTFQWYTALLYPVPLIFFFVVFARSARRSGKQVRWKGRDIPGD